MARKHSGEIVTRTIRQRQKNGDIYVIERKTQYDPEKKYNVVLPVKSSAKFHLDKTRSSQLARNALTEKKFQICQLLS